MAMEEDPTVYTLPLYNEPDNLRMSTPGKAQKRAIRAAVQLALTDTLRQTYGTDAGEQVMNDSVEEGEIAQRETLFYSPIHQTISSLEVGQSAVVTSEDLARGPSRGLWSENGTSAMKTAGSLLSMQGGDLATMRDRGLMFLVHPVTGERLTPGFEQVSTVGNEGMVCVSTLGKTFLISAKDQQDAIRTYLGRPGDDPMLAYPLFLQGSELLVTRFDAGAAKAQNHHTLLQLQGKDPFGLEKETVDPADKKGRETFDLVMQVVQSHEGNNITPLAYRFDETAVHTYFPDIDNEVINAQMVASRYIDGGIVISLQGRLDEHDGRQGGFFLVQHPHGKVMLCDMGYSQVVDGTTPKQEKTFSDALDYILKYNSQVIGSIFSQPVTMSQLQRRKNASKAPDASWNPRNDIRFPKP